MNYTEQYRLPQWEKSDRVLMDDFNQAMANIEDGLLALDASGEEHGFRRACRIAYNHFHLLRTFSPLPWQDGVFYQNAALSDEGVSGMTKFDGCCLLNYTDGITPEALFRTFQQTSQLKVGPAGMSAALAASFIAPCSGYLSRLGVSVTAKGGNGEKVSCQIVCTDLTTGEAKTPTTYSLGTPGSTSMTYPAGLTANLYFRQGHRYQVRVTAEKTAAVDITMDISATDMTVDSLITGGEGSVRHTFSGPWQNAGALVIAQFDGANVPKLFWNRQEIPASAVHELEAERQEVIFVRKEDVRAGDVMELTLSCSKNQEAAFYEWGAVLI